MTRTIANVQVRDCIEKSGLYHWEVADLLNMNNTVFSRKLRHELPADEQERICKVIRDHIGA